MVESSYQDLAGLAKVRADYYYLAEHSTSSPLSAASARSRAIWQPYEKH